MQTTTCDGCGKSIEDKEGKIMVSDFRQRQIHQPVKRQKNYDFCGECGAKIIEFIQQKILPA